MAPDSQAVRKRPSSPGAKRELLEEAGITAERWTEILRMELSNSASDEHAVLYVARGLSFQAPQPDHNEELAQRKLPFSELYGMVVRGEVLDSLTVAAVLRVQLMIQEGTLPG